MALLLALVLLLAPAHVEGQALSARIAVSPEIAPFLPPIDALEAGVARHFQRSYGGFVEDISFEVPAPAAANAETVVITLGRRGDAVSASTDLTSGRQTRSISSTVPLGAPVGLLSAIAGDIAFLHFSRAGFAAIPLSPPPSMTATVQTDTLAGLTGWDPAELEPIGLASAGNGLTVCFPHRYLTLGPSFRLTEATIADIDQQASGKEPVQISGVVTDAGTGLILLSEREGRIIRLDPRLGTRQALAAPGLPPLGARLLGPDSLAVLSNARDAVGLLVFPLSGAAPYLVPIHASYLSAFSRDREGNLWAWDAEERRVRVVTPGGREVYSIRPLFGASTMQLPQQLEVFDDGSFLLGGSGEVWKFRSSGMPVWRLTRIPGRPGERLPSSFSLAAGGADGSFFLLDAPSRRLMMFSPSPTVEEPPLASMFSRMSARAPADLQEAAGLARKEGLSLVAWQLGDLLVKRGGSTAERGDARIAILRERSGRYADFADSLARDLLYDRADAAYARAAESARELTAEAPADEDGAKLLQRIAASRLEMRAAFARKPDIRFVSAAAEIRRSDACRDLLVVTLRVRNAGAAALSGLRVHASAPSVSDSPSLSVADRLASGEEREVAVPLDLTVGAVGSALEGRNLRVAILVTYRRGMEGVSVRASLDVPVASTGPRRTTADLMACALAPADQLVAGLADELLPGTAAGATREDSVAAFAGILDSLGSLRSGVASAAARAAGGVRGPIGPGAVAGVREALRGLSPNELDWTLVTLSVAAALGLPVGVLSWEDRAFALIDTGIPLADALSGIPGLSAYAAVLERLTRGGTLCVPLSGAVATGPGGASAWAFVDALRACSVRAAGKAMIWWRNDASGRPVSPALPMPIPYPLPAIRVPPSRDTLRAGVIQSLEQQK
jgi:hypothetical protein